MPPPFTDENMRDFPSATLSQSRLTATEIRIIMTPPSLPEPSEEPWNLSKLKTRYIVLTVVTIFMSGILMTKEKSKASPVSAEATPVVAVVNPVVNPSPTTTPRLISEEQATIASLRRDNAALRQQLQASTVRVEKAIPVERPTPRKNTDSVSQQLIEFDGPKESLPDFKVDDDSSSKSSYTISSTGKRHNSNCRYYTSPRSRPCGPKDGIACKVCGG
jgi:hypothetical protein